MIATVPFFLWLIGTNSQIKLKLNVPGRTLAECNTRYSANLVRLTDNQLCAGGEKGRDSCRGMCASNGIHLICLDFRCMRYGPMQTVWQYDKNELLRCFVL